MHCVLLSDSHHRYILDDGVTERTKLEFPPQQTGVVDVKTLSTTDEIFERYSNVVNVTLVGLDGV